VIRVRLPVEGTRRSTIDAVEITPPMPSGTIRDDQPKTRRHHGGASSFSFWTLGAAEGIRIMAMARVPRTPRPFDVSEEPPRTRLGADDRSGPVAPLPRRRTQFPESG